MRKPFDVLADGLVSKNSRGDWHSFEPALTMVKAYAAAFLEPLGPQLQVAARLAQSCG
jgi:hypothetical protein